MDSEIIWFGTMATLCCIFSLFSDDENFNYAVSATWFLSLFWAANTFLWMLDSIKYYVLTDSIFAAVMFAMFMVSRLRWLVILAIMYCGNVILDVAYLHSDISYYHFAYTSNVLFIAELIMACNSGLLQSALFVRRSLAGK
jgi:hypothetical protein